MDGTKTTIKPLAKFTLMDMPNDILDAIIYELIGKSLVATINNKAKTDDSMQAVSNANAPLIYVNVTKSGKIEFNENIKKIYARNLPMMTAIGQILCKANLLPRGVSIDHDGMIKIARKPNAINKTTLRIMAVGIDEAIHRIMDKKAVINTIVNLKRTSKYINQFLNNQTVILALFNNLKTHCVDHKKEYKKHQIAQAIYNTVNSAMDSITREGIAATIKNKKRTLTDEEVTLGDKIIKNKYRGCGGTIMFYGGLTTLIATTLLLLYNQDRQPAWIHNTVIGVGVFLILISVMVIGIGTYQTTTLSDMTTRLKNLLAPANETTPLLSQTSTGNNKVATTLPPTQNQDDGSDLIVPKEQSDSSDEQSDSSDEQSGPSLV